MRIGETNSSPLAESRDRSIGHDVGEADLHARADLAQDEKTLEAPKDHIFTEVHRILALQHGANGAKPQGKEEVAHSEPFCWRKDLNAGMDKFRPSDHQSVFTTADSLDCFKTQYATR